VASIRHCRRGTEFLLTGNEAFLPIPLRQRRLLWLCDGRIRRLKLRDATLGVSHLPEAEAADRLEENLTRVRPHVVRREHDALHTVWLAQGGEGFGSVIGQSLSSPRTTPSKLRPDKLGKRSRFSRVCTAHSEEVIED
jgi:hypothetical protein